MTVNAVFANEQWLNSAFKNDFKIRQNKDSLTATLIKCVTIATKPKAKQMEGAGRAITGLDLTNSQLKTEYSKFSIQLKTVKIGGSVL